MERRYKRLYVSTQMIISLFALDLAQPGHMMTRFRLKDTTIPDDVEVVNAGYACNYNAICLILYHELWPIIDEDVVVPIINGKEDLFIQGFLVTDQTKIEHTTNPEPISNWRKLKAQL